MSYKPRSLFRLIDEINRSLFLPHIQRLLGRGTDASVVRQPDAELSNPDASILAHEG
jgi:hypothetical protein